MPGLHTTGQKKHVEKDAASCSSLPDSRRDTVLTAPQQHVRQRHHIQIKIFTGQTNRYVRFSPFFHKVKA